MKVLVIASDKEETKVLDSSYIKAVSGVGPIMAAISTAIAIKEHDPDIVISLGSAGAISPDLSIGEAYSFSSVVTPDQNLTAFHIALGDTLDFNRKPIGRIMTADIDSSLTLGSSGTFNKEIRPWHKRLQVDAADMEAYGVALASRRMDKRFYAIKLITDVLGDGSNIGNVLFNLRSGRDRMIALLDSLVSTSSVS